MLYIFSVSQVIDKRGKVIVLEDDLVTATNALVYMNFMLNKYKDEKKLYSIAVYNHLKTLIKYKI